MTRSAGALIAAALCSSCIDYSSYQDARIVERGVSQGTVAVSASKAQTESNSDNFNWFVVDGNPRWGLGGRFDAAFKMSILFTDEDLGGAVVGGDIRFGAGRNYLAFTLPVTMAIGSYAFSTTNLQPGVILTLPVGDQVDVNGSVRRSFYLNEDVEPNAWWLYNAGLGIKVAPEWRIRPEIAWMVAEHEDDQSTYMQFGIGVTREVAAPPATRASE